MASESPPSDKAYRVLAMMSSSSSMAVSLMPVSEKLSQSNHTL
jgi:hypothetical protein